MTIFGVNKSNPYMNIPTCNLQGELESFLVEITAIIMSKPDEKRGQGFLVDAILDKTGMKGTGSVQ